MITEDYINFETAKLLKEKGFDESVTHYYFTQITHVGFKNYPTGVLYTDSYPQHQNNYKNKVAAPTQALVMKWLREVYKVIPIILTGDNRHDGVIIYYWFRIDTIKNGRWKDAVYREDEIEYPTYEQACEAAIKYCLENLVKDEQKFVNSTLEEK